MKLSENFRSEEFQCRCGCRAAQMQYKFISRLQRLRQAHGRPLIITSGFRCLPYNKAIHGAADSRHGYGDAADILVENAIDRYDILQHALMLGFTGIGIGANYVHLDIRETDAPLMWVYITG